MTCPVCGSDDPRPCSTCVVFPNHKGDCNHHEPEKIVGGVLCTGAMPTGHHANLRALATQSPRRHQTGRQVMADRLPPEMQEWLRNQVADVRASYPEAVEAIEDDIRDDEAKRVFAAIRQVGTSETFIAGDGHPSIAMLTADEIVEKATALLTREASGGNDTTERKEPK